MKRYAFCFTLAFLLAVVAWQATTSAVSQLAWMSGQRELEQGQRSGEPVSARQFEYIAAELNRSIHWCPDYAPAWESLGDYGWLEYVQNRIPPTGTRFTHFYRESLSRQHAKARYWAKLAYAKATLDEFDSDFIRAYDNAFAYGGYEYEVGHSLMETGFAHWYSLGVEYHLILKEVSRRLYAVAPSATLDFAEYYGQQHMMCIWIKDVSYQLPRCQRVLADRRPLNRRRS